MLVRDWRAGELRVLAVALVIAVAAITSVGFFADRVGQALVRDAHQLLGADLVLVSDHPWNGEIAQEIRSRGLHDAAAINFVSMAFAGETSQLAGVKAVTQNYPLRGRLRTAPAPGAPDAAAERGPRPGTVWLEERLVSALQAPVGARVRLGKAELEVAAVLTLEPERSANFFNLAPRLMMNAQDVPATGLIQTGSRVSYFLYAAGTPQAVTRVRERDPHAPRARPAHRQPRDRPAGGARLGRARAAIPGPHGAARRGARRRGHRAGHAALCRAPPRRLRRDALPRGHAGEAGERCTPWSSCCSAPRPARPASRSATPRRRRSGPRSRACCAPRCRRRRHCRRCRAFSSA